MASTPSFFSSSLPAKVPEHDVPAYRPAAMPSLPASSGAIFGSAVRRLQKDTDLVNAHTNYLTARTGQHNAAAGLMQSRISGELVATDLANIDAIKLHKFREGQHDRVQAELVWTHQDQLAALKRETELMQAESARLQAEAALAELKKVQPPPPPEPAQPSQAPVEPGLSLDDIEDVVTAGLPEVSEDGKFAFLRMLRGMLAEKTKDKPA